MRRVLVLMALIAAAPAPAGAASGLLGIWDIDIVGGTAHGDAGVIAIAEDPQGRLVADLEYRDADARITASERCEVRERGELVSITCTVLAPDSPLYLPDNFNLRVVAPDRMEGRLHSATSGPAVFIRREVPLS